MQRICECILANDRGIDLEYGRPAYSHEIQSDEQAKYMLKNDEDRSCAEAILARLSNPSQLNPEDPESYSGYCVSANPYQLRGMIWVAVREAHLNIASPATPEPTCSGTDLKSRVLHEWNTPPVSVLSRKESG